LRNPLSTFHSRISKNTKLPSILSRVTYSNILLAFVIIVTSSLLFILYLQKSLHTQFEAEIEHLLDVASSDLTVALSFEDHEAVQKIILSLNKTNFIQQIVVYNSKKEPFEIIGKIDSITPQRLKKHLDFKGNAFISENVRNLYLNSGLLGSLVLSVDSYEIWSLVLHAIVIVALLATALFLLNYILGCYLLKRLLAPILQLSTDMSQIAYKKDYSLRANSTPNTCESEVLIEGFNAMLSEIQIRDHSLEAIVTQRTLQLHQALEDAQQAKELAESGSRSKSEFLASMSHEIRTPLNGISTLTELMLGTVLSPSQKEDLLAIRVCLVHLRGIIDSILDISKIEAGKLYLDESILDLGASLANPIDLLKKQAIQKGINFSYFISPEIPNYTKGDALRIIQIVNNLAGNAIKFTKPKQSVTINITKKSQIDAHSFNCCIEVEDTGIGMSKEEQTHIFEPFSQGDSSTTQKYGGTGLGLTIVHKLIALMNGSIEISSEKGKGTLARVIIPLKTFDLNADNQEQEYLNQSSALLFHHQEVRSTLNGMVLFVEDNEINQKSITRILEMAGLSVVTASNGEDAVTLFTMFGTFDIIITDLRMPIMDGFETSSHIRAIEKEILSEENKKQSKPIPIIALTADLTDSIRTRCYEAGINDVIFKPVNVNQLIKRIAELIN
jgi:two-component system, sensor histidine kinase